MLGRGRYPGPRKYQHARAPPLSRVPFAPPSTLAIFRLLRRPIPAGPLQRSALRPPPGRARLRASVCSNEKWGQCRPHRAACALAGPRGGPEGELGQVCGLGEEGGGARQGFGKPFSTPSPQACPQACDDGSLGGGGLGGGGSGKPHAGLTPPPGALPFFAFYGEEVRPSGSASGAGVGAGQACRELRPGVARAGLRWGWPACLSDRPRKPGLGAPDNNRPTLPHPTSHGEAGAEGGLDPQAEPAPGLGLQPTQG